MSYVSIQGFETGIGDILPKENPFYTSLTQQTPLEWKFEPWKKTFIILGEQWDVARKAIKVLESEFVKKEPFLGQAKYSPSFEQIAKGLGIPIEEFIALGRKAPYFRYVEVPNEYTGDLERAIVYQDKMYEQLKREINLD